MPYAGENNSISMYVFLTGKDIDSFLERVTHKMLDQVLFDRKSDGPRHCEVHIQLPKMAIQRKVDLEPVNTRMT